MRPTGLSRLYHLRLDYAEGDSPIVTVEDPDLVLLADGARLPHVYRQRPTELCLYLPGAGEWKPTDRFDLTVLPWAALWLLYYEDWLARGCQDWQGGGMHPEDGEPASRLVRRGIERRRRDRESGPPRPKGRRAFASITRP